MDDLTHVVWFTGQVDGSILTIDQPVVVVIPLGKIVTRSRGKVLLYQPNHVFNLKQDRENPYRRLSDTFEFARLRNRCTTDVVLAVSDVVVPDKFRRVA